MRGTVSSWAAIIKKKKKRPTISRSQTTAARRGPSSKGSAVFVRWLLMSRGRRRWWRLDQPAATIRRTTGAPGARSTVRASIRSVLFGDKGLGGRPEHAAQLAG